MKNIVIKFLKKALNFLEKENGNIEAEKELIQANVVKKECNYTDFFDKDIVKDLQYVVFNEKGFFEIEVPKLNVITKFKNKIYKNEQVDYDNQLVFY